MSAGNEPAYPREHYSHSVGLTKRELVAAMAMQGLLAKAGKTHGSYSEDDWAHELPQAEALWVAESAMRYADALLAQLSKEPT